MKATAAIAGGLLIGLFTIIIAILILVVLNEKNETPVVEKSAAQETQKPLDLLEANLEIGDFAISNKGEICAVSNKHFEEGEENILLDTHYFRFWFKRERELLCFVSVVRYKDDPQKHREVYLKFISGEMK